MSKRSYIISAVIFGFVGTLLRIIAYQNASQYGTSEWVYDLDSIAYALETLWPFLLSIGVCKYLPKLKILHLIRIPAACYSYIGLFDMSKEIAGLNLGGGWIEVFAFSCGLFLTALFQYHVYRYNTTE